VGVGVGVRGVDDLDTHLDVVCGERGGFKMVLDWLWVGGGGCFEGFEGVRLDHPRGDGRAEVFSDEGAERWHLKYLDVSR